MIADILVTTAHPSAFPAKAVCRKILKYNLPLHYNPEINYFGELAKARFASQLLRGPYDTDSEMNN